MFLDEQESAAGQVMVAGGLGDAVGLKTVNQERKFFRWLEVCQKQVRAQSLETNQIGV